MRQARKPCLHTKCLPFLSMAVMHFDFHDNHLIGTESLSSRATKEARGAERQARRHPDGDKRDKSKPVSDHQDNLDLFALTRAAVLFTPRLSALAAALVALTEGIPEGLLHCLHAAAPRWR